MLKKLDNSLIACTFSPCRSLLLSAICSANDNFYRLVADTSEEMVELEEAEDGEYEIHGYRFREAVAKR